MTRDGSENPCASPALRYPSRPRTVEARGQLTACEGSGCGSLASVPWQAGTVR